MELNSLVENEDYQYYHVIPTEVLHSKKLSDKSKLLFVTISGLCNNTGKSWATNSYYEKTLGWSKSTVNRALVELKTLKVIIIHNEYKGETIVKRTITTPYKKLKEKAYHQRDGGMSPEISGHVTGEPDNSSNRIVKKNNKPSASFFSKKKSISEMSFEEWETQAINEDREHHLDITKYTGAQLEYHQILREYRFEKLKIEEAKTNTKK